MVHVKPSKALILPVFNALVLVFSVLLPGLSRAGDTSPDALLVLSKKDDTLALVNPSTSQVMARIPVGNDPHEVTASTDGKTAFVSNYGFGAYNTLAVVDLVGQKALPAIDLGPLRGPHGLTFVGGKTWFTAEAAKAIGRYDPASGKVDWILGTGQNRTHMLYVAPDMSWIVTTNVSSGTVSIIEKTMPGEGQAGPPSGMPTRAGSGMPSGPPGPPQSAGGPPPSREGDWNETVVRVGNGSEGFDVTPGGKEIWVANAQDGTVSIIDVSRRQVVETLAVQVKGANRLKFTPDGSLALVSALGGPDLTVIDAATRKTIKRIPIGHGAAGIVMQPDGSRAYVACSPDGYVAIIDLHSLAMVGRIEAGDNPDGMAWVTRH